ncbi:RsfA family transcriptional regulator, partial [Microbacteriaceae bacterium K1510]|nr:RsfA family transcriptional regulator [Microbacteriaceae bacterium K1510]
MVASRQDAWTEDDDLVLAEVTLRHIREGGTQLAAFEEVGQRLGRTAAACGFRWNSAVRKRYDAAIAIAKGQRQQLKKLGRLQLQTEFAEETP